LFMVVVVYAMFVFHVERDAYADGAAHRFSHMPSPCQNLVQAARIDSGAIRPARPVGELCVAWKYMPSAAALTDAAADAAGGGDLDSALALVRRALSLEPQSVPALVCLGNVLAERGDASGAATAYGVALQAAPHSFEAHANAGLLAAEQPGRRAAALAHLRAALAINPSWGDGCYNLANLLSAYEATTAS
jgi:tetratricopeptide (TPR) repeat protein